MPVADKAAIIVENTTLSKPSSSDKVDVNYKDEIGRRSQDVSDAFSKDENLTDNLSEKVLDVKSTCTDIESLYAVPCKLSKNSQKNREILFNSNSVQPAPNKQKCEEELETESEDNFANIRNHIKNEKECNMKFEEVTVQNLNNVNTSLLDGKGDEAFDFHLDSNISEEAESMTTTEAEHLLSTK